MAFLKSLSSLILVGILFLIIACKGDQDTNTTSLVGTKVAIDTAKAEVFLDQLQLPNGFSIEVWAANVPNARSMALTEEGIVFVGNRQEKNVYALLDENGDGKADVKYVLATDLQMPNGVAYKDGDLYVAEVSRILRFKDIKNN